MWTRFGDNTIPAGGNVTVSGNATVPAAVYASWSRGSAPPVFLYSQTDRGDLTKVMSPLTRAAPSPSGS